MFSRKPLHRAPELLPVWRRAIELTAVNWTWLEQVLGQELRRRSPREPVLAAAVENGTLRSLLELFDRDYYLRANPDVREHGGDPFIHYVLYGEREGRRPCALFDPSYYREQLRPATDISSLLGHFERVGARAGLSPHRAFDPKFYLATYPDVREAGINPLVHFLSYGLSEARLPNPRIVPDRYCGIASTLTPEVFELTAEQYEPRAPINPEGEACASPGTDVDSRVVSCTRPHVLYFSHNFERQGAQRSLFELATGLHRHRHVRATVWSSGDGPFRSDYDRAGVPASKIVFPSRGDDNEREYRKYTARLAQDLADAKPALVHANTLQSFYAVKAAQECNVPCVWNIRESEPPATYFNYLPAYLRPEAYRAYEAATAIVFVSETTRKMWESHITRDRIYTVHNGVNGECFAGHRTRQLMRTSLGYVDDTVVFLGVGTVSDRKNQQLAVDAFTRLSPRARSRSALILLGMNSSEYSQQLARSVGALPVSLRSRIRLEPETTGPDAARLVGSHYRCADVFVMASKVESYPRVIVEAMSFGLPVLSTPCFGAREQVDLTCGEFFPPDDPEVLADAMTRMIEDPCYRRSLGQGALRRHEHVLVTYGDMLDSYLQIYRECMATETV